MLRGEPDHRLRHREREVLLLVAGGCTAAEVATELMISHHTARVHLQNIRANLEARSITHALALAIVYGLIRDDELLKTYSPKD